MQTCAACYLLKHWCRSCKIHHCGCTWSRNAATCKSRAAAFRQLKIDGKVPHDAEMEEHDAPAD